MSKKSISISEKSESQKSQSSPKSLTPEQIKGLAKIEEWSKPRRRSSKKSNRLIKTTIKSLNLECVKPRRAGVILYTFFEETTYFGIGLDSKTHDLTDFGGTIKYKTDLNVLNGALREFNEETLQIFEPLSGEDIANSSVIYDNDNLIIFIHMELVPDLVCSNFNTQYHNLKYAGINPEVCGITWLSWEDFQTSLSTKGVFFSRVQKFLLRAGDFSHLL